jgi:hypothetical protein
MDANAKVIAIIDRRIERSLNLTSLNILKTRYPEIKRSIDVTDISK